MFELSEFKDRVAIYPFWCSLHENVVFTIWSISNKDWHVLEFGLELVDPKHFHLISFCILNNESDFAWGRDAHFVARMQVHPQIHLVSQVATRDLSYSVAGCEQLEYQVVGRVFNFLSDVWVVLLADKLGYFVDFDFVLGEGAGFIEAEGAYVCGLSGFFRLSAVYLFVLEANERVWEGEIEVDGYGGREAPVNEIHEPKTHKSWDNSVYH